MAREQTLLERIASGGHRSRGRVQPTQSEDPEALMESVRRNLWKLLRSRHGMCEAQPDYGLPAFTDLIVSGGSEYLAVTQEAIRLAIEKFEPRLQRVRVSRVIDAESDQRTLAFRIDAVLVGHSGEHRVWYQSSLAGDGQFEVTE
jgi:type VI secretion system lysozyme-like protein